MSKNGVIENWKAYRYNHAKLFTRVQFRVFFADKKISQKAKIKPDCLFFLGTAPYPIWAEKKNL